MSNFTNFTAQDTRALAIGTVVYCTVTRTVHTVQEVRQRDGYIKIDGFRGWCPPFNFRLLDSNQQ